jgi:tRNA threonylcarbamoyladenosine biosynthesis protein TsaE
MEPLILHLTSPQETTELATRLAQHLQAKDFVGLLGQLGAGKTVFARGLAHGLDVDMTQFSSPTYSLVHAYQGRIALQHWDWYRLRDDDDLLSTGYFDLLETPAALLVEWADRVPKAIPPDWLRLELRAVNSSHRVLTATAHGPRSLELLRAAFR